MSLEVMSALMRFISAPFSDAPRQRHAAPPVQCAAAAVADAAVTRRLPLSARHFRRSACPPFSSVAGRPLRFSSPRCAAGVSMPENIFAPAKEPPPPASIFAQPPPAAFFPRLPLPADAAKQADAASAAFAPTRYRRRHAEFFDAPSVSRPIFFSAAPGDAA